MMEIPFGGATSGSIVLYTMAKKKQHLYQHVIWFSLPSFPLPIDAKSVLSEGLQAGTRLENGTFGIVVSSAIILGTLIEANKPLLDTLCLANPLPSGRNGVPQRHLLEVPLVRQM